MDFEEIFSIQRGVADRIKNRRESTGYSKEDLAAYLHKRWGIAKITAYSRICDYEAGSFNVSGDTTTKIRGSQRFNDFLTAIGLTPETDTGIIDDIRKVEPDYTFVPSSDISPYIRDTSDDTSHDTQIVAKAPDYDWVIRLKRYTDFLINESGKRGDIEPNDFDEALGRLRQEFAEVRKYRTEETDTDE